MIGDIVLKLFAPFLEYIAPIMPGEIFSKFFFEMEIGQQALLASIFVTFVSGFLGVFLLMRNLALIGDGLAHVSFGGVALAIVFSSTTPLYYALLLSIISAIIIYELQVREILSGDASIGIFLTGMLALGLVALRIWGGGVQNDIEGYLFGNLLLVDKESFNLIWKELGNTKRLILPALYYLSSLLLVWYHYHLRKCHDYEEWNWLPLHILEFRILSKCSTLPSKSFQDDLKLTQLS